MAEIEFIDDHHGQKEIAEVLPRVVQQLRDQADSLATPLRRTYRGHNMPSRDEIVQMVELLRSVIFPGYYGNRDIREESLGFHMGSTLDRVALIMADEVQRGLCFACTTAPGDGVPARCAARARRITAEFLYRSGAALNAHPGDCEDRDASGRDELRRDRPRLRWNHDRTR